MKATTPTRKRKDPNVYPPGLDLRGTREIAKYYDALRDRPVLDKEATARRALDSVWIEVPQDLVPQIRKLIAKHRKTA